MYHLYIFRSKKHIFPPVCMRNGIQMDFPALCRVRLGSGNGPKSRSGKILGKTVLKKKTFVSRNNGYQIESLLKLFNIIAL